MTSPLANAKHGLDNCIHCGFCLPACPTYLALGDENDSPRGRLVLMRELVTGALAVDDRDVQTHIDRCLGCRACETACPSGVPYGELLEATRATLPRRATRPLVARLILWVFAQPLWLSIALFGARLMRGLGIADVLTFLPGRFGFSMGMLASTRSPLPRRGYPSPTDAVPQNGRVAVLKGCVMNGLYHATNEATARTLQVNGYEVVPAKAQRCCGALHAHAGDLAAARRLARHNIDAFERSGADYIAINAAGCGAMVKEYGVLLADDPGYAERAAALAQRARDVTELLAATGPVSGAAIQPRRLKVTYDAPCHLLHAQRVTQAPLAVLASIPGLDVVPLTDADQCCGSAGIYNLTQPALSTAVLAPKLAHVEATGATLVATGNPGCLMQIGAGLRRAGSRARTVHPVDLLDAAYAARFNP